MAEEQKSKGWFKGCLQIFIGRWDIFNNLNHLRNMRLMYFLFFVLVIFFSCSQQEEVESDDSDVTGTYYDPVTGEILFKILKDSLGYKLKDISLDPYVYGESRFERIVIPDEKNEKSWGDWCGGDLDIVLERAFGGEDWKNNLVWYVRVEKSLIVKVRKGYHSNEHIYNTEYAIIEGSDCFNRMRLRRNIDKL